MADNPTPSPHSPLASSSTEPPSSLPATNAGDGSAALPESAPGSTLLERLHHQAINLGLLAGIWVIALIGLLLAGYGRADAIGFATVAALVGSFFTRSLLPQPSEKVQASSPATQPHHNDSAREIIETVVFVVVLVLLLKSFVAEAFVIPTGSMAETLWGYQKVVTCPQCGLQFPVNCSSEVDPSDGNPPSYVRGCTCPNCRQDITFWRPDPNNPNQAPPAQVGLIPDPRWRSGDRVLVAKYVYDLPPAVTGLEKSPAPDRLDVVVFKFPGENDFPRSGPVKRHVAINYIKRLIGKPGETIALHRGKLWLLPPEESPKYDDFAKSENNPGARAVLWQREYTHHNDPAALELFHANKFQIVRKKPENILAMMRIVYDHDHQPLDLRDKPEFQRWIPASNSGWTASGRTAFEHNGEGDKVAWLHYRHVLRNSPDRPQLITDFTGYNTWMGGPHQTHPRENWASDLLVDCEVKVDKAEGTFALELSRGNHRYQASFNLATGDCTLYDEDKGKQPQALQTAGTAMKGPGTYHIRFGNMDDRLVVWVNDRLPFGEGVNYSPIRNIVPTKENDLERPVSVGVKGARLTVSKLKVFRDTYYTTSNGGSPAAADVDRFRPDDPDTFPALGDAPVATFYVQPDHFLCLGDNSPESSDGRTWGLVPQRLLLGRALLVYYPFSRAGRIR
ncbi:MAG: S26 family signal peptidase [Gemmataceae bacterium]